jgi:hypothetical protein
MDPEIVERLNEQFREMTDILSQQNASMAAMVKNMQDQSGAVKKQVAATNASAGATDNLTKKQLAYQQAQEQRLEQERQANAVIQRFTKVLDFSRDAVYSLGSVVLDTNNNFQKYNQVIGSVGDAARDLGRNFGILGTVLGEVIKGFTFLLEKQLIQTDNLLSFNDQISRLGAANSFSTKTIQEMAHTVGLTTGELDKLTKPMQNLGSSFKTMGDGTANATRAFADMANVGKEARQEFQRLGYNDQERIEAQAKFIDVMTASGTSVLSLSKATGGLAKISLDYQKNLTIISEITGLTAEQQQEQQKINAANMQWQVYEAQMAQKMLDAKTEAERKKIEEELTGARNARDILAQRYGEVGAAMAGQYFSGNPITIQGGISAMALQRTEGDVQAILRGGKEGMSMEELGRLNQELAKKQVGFAAGPLGTALSVDASGDFAKAAGMTPKQMAENNIAAQRDSATAARLAEKAIKENEGKEPIGPSAEDPAQQTRNFLKEVIERPLALFMDNFLAFFNPLLGNTGAFAALAAGMGVATLALGKFALSATRAAASGIFTRLAGVAAAGTAGTAGVAAAGTAGVAAAGTAGVAAAGTASASKLGKLGGLAKSAGRVLGKLAWPLTAGMALYDAYQGFNADADASFGGKLLNAGKSALSGLTFGLLGSSPEEIAARKTNQTEGQPSVQDSGERVVTQFDRSVEQFGQFITIFGRLVTASAKLVTASANVTKAFATSVKSFKDVVGSLNGPNARTGENSVIAALNNLTSLLREKSPKSSARGLIGTPLDSEDDEDIADYIDRLKNSLKDTTSNLDFMREAEIKRHNFNEMSMRQFRQSLDDLSKSIGDITGIDRTKTDRNNPGGAPGGGGEGAGSTENAQKAMDYFMKQGWTKEQAAGIVGNLQQESGKNLDPSSENEIGMYGIAQWDKTRRKQFEQFTGRSIYGSSLEDQLAFIQHELTEGKDPQAKKGGKELRSATTASEAAMIFEKRYERSGGHALGKRIANAEALMTAGTDTSVPVTDQKLISSKPNNVTVEADADLSRVSSKLLQRFFSAAKEFGGRINVNSAYRTDQKQAELWVRGNILGERGIHTPARPKNDTTITYRGKQYVVQGSGIGSKHGQGQALDISTDRESFDPFLLKYGLHRPFKRTDPPHIELKAAQGGIFDGPTSGYPAELHGGEMVAPLDANSVLMKLAKTPADATQPNALPTPTSIEKETIEKLVTGNQEMLDVMIRKLEDMVSAISDGNDVREKIFKNTVA